MKPPIPSINPKKETEKISHFIKTALKKTGFKKIVIGLSGGIDSTTCLYLIRKVLPPQNIFITYLPYFQPPNYTRGKPNISVIKKVCYNLQIPEENQYIISIKKPVDSITHMFKISNLSDHGRVRIGNIMARVRMIIIYDLAKKHNALVCGTENKSEHLLGYFTRFGDEASDIEPILHLYKTQVYQLARSLKIPEEIINAKPTAGLWTGQTDEAEFGFSYEEADQVLYLYFDQKLSLDEIKKRRFKNAIKILEFVKKNSFKHHTPYTLTPVK